MPAHRSGHTNVNMFLRVRAARSSVFFCFQSSAFWLFQRIRQDDVLVIAAYQVGRHLWFSQRVSDRIISCDVWGSGAARSPSLGAGSAVGARLPRHGQQLIFQDSPEFIPKGMSSTAVRTRRWLVRIVSRREPSNGASLESSRARAFQGCPVRIVPRERLPTVAR